MQKTETNELLRGSGRDLAVQLMESAIESAESKEQMHSQMQVLRAMGTHVLATLAFNLERQCGAIPAAALEEVVRELRCEIEFLREAPAGEMLMHLQGGGVET